MEPSYSFVTGQFALSAQGIHLLRNSFNFQTLAFKEIDFVEVKSGMDMKNWLLVLFVGLVLAGYGVFDICQIIWLFNNPTVREIYIQRLLVPVIPLLLGIYSIVIALRKAKVMVVKTEQKTYHFSLREIDQAGQLAVFLEELRAYKGVRILS